MFSLTLHVLLAFEDTIIRKMFVVPSFEIHGGVKGLFDLGPPACGLKANMIDVWRKHFVLEENMLEVSFVTLHILFSCSSMIQKNENNENRWNAPI